MHSYPDFLSANASTLVAATPLGCTQLINIFVSAFPADIELPDPFGDSIDTLPEMSQLPATIPVSSQTVTFPPELRAALDRVLTGDATMDTLSGLTKRFVHTEPPQNADSQYNYALLYVVIEHLCSAAVGSSGKTTFSSSSPAVAIYERLMADFDIEGRYVLVSGIVNLLRWPNAHTRWAKQLLVHAYSTTEDVEVKEVVARVLLERLLVARPHPWGAVWAMGGLIRENLLQEPFVQKVRSLPLLISPSRGLRERCSTPTLRYSSPRLRHRFARSKSELRLTITIILGGRLPLFSNLGVIIIIPTGSIMRVSVYTFVLLCLCFTPLIHRISPHLHSFLYVAMNAVAVRRSLALASEREKTRAPLNLDLQLSVMRHLA